MNLTQIQYADNTQLYLTFDLEKQEEAIAKMEVCLNDIRLWMKENKLNLNEDIRELVVIIAFFIDEYHNMILHERTMNSL